MTLNYGDIVRRAWQITWNHKILWLFGILAGLGGGGGNVNFNQNFGGGGGTGTPTDLPRIFEQFTGRLDETTVLLIVIGAIVAVIVLAIAFLVLSIIGRGGLIGGVQLADRKNAVTLGEAWQLGLKYFVPVLLIGLAVFVLNLVIGAASLFAALTICLAPLACVLGLLSIPIAVIAYFAQIAVVTENLPAPAAASRAWQIIRDNFGTILVLGLIVFGVSFVVGLVLAAPFILIAGGLVVSLLAGASGEAPQVGNTGALLAGLCLLAYLPVVIVLGGILQSWVTATWTLAYERLTGRAAASIMPAPAPVPPSL